MSQCAHTKTTFSPLSGGQCCDDCGFMLDPFPSTKDDDDGSPGQPVATPAWAAPMPTTRAPAYPLMGDQPTEQEAALEEAPPSAVAPGTATEWLDCTHIGPVWETQTRLVKVRGGAAVQEHRHRLVEIEMTENGNLRSWRLFSNKGWVKGMHKATRGGGSA